MSYQFCRQFAQNDQGRDFVVGDLHGMYSHLEKLLDHVKFDQALDRLFSVGDLIDRGPESERAIEFLAKPWFFAVSGNHEQLLLDALDNPGDMENWTTHNGGAWWLKAAQATREQFVRMIPQLPVIIEIETNKGTVGIVHADVPPDMPWDVFKNFVPKEPRLQDFALWSRNRVTHAQQWIQSGQNKPVPGLHRLVVGHTPLERAVILDNVLFLDTAAAYSQNMPFAKLSLYQIHPNEELFELPTAEPGPDI